MPTKDRLEVLGHPLNPGRGDEFVYLCTARAIGPVVVPIAIVDRTVFVAPAAARVAPAGAAPLPKGRRSSGRRPRVLRGLQVLQLVFSVGVVHFVGQRRLAGDERVVGEVVVLAPSAAAARTAFPLANNVGLRVVWASKPEIL